MPNTPPRSEMAEAPEESPLHATTAGKHRSKDSNEVHIKKHSDSKSVVPDQNIKDLARRVSNAHIKADSSANSTSTPPSQPDYDNVNNPLSPRPGSNLDPNSATFDSSTWTKEFIKLTELDPECVPRRALGVAFKDLSVFGSSTGAQFQMSVGNVVASTAKDLARVVSNSKHHERRVSILRDFEGVVERGEMLLVLGPPGSGCSTFLKTLSSQTVDLEVDEDAYINYRGETSTASTTAIPVISILLRLLLRN